MSPRLDCSRCDGTGHVEDDVHGSPLCPDCGGTGAADDDSRYVPWSEEPRDCLSLSLYGRTLDNEGP